ncbi:type I phosphomannose isomerase catalytic subunit [Anaerolentibacter hominis]|uniref:type I phosphomannose isomerase catalytic subunit n=1 Tax=Anaerolentibacter hominis TaxID=3079009 RepID=UPI0031B80C80
MKREPFRLTAPLKDYLWGGTKLKEEFHKQSELDKVAESWELSCHKDGTSRIADGPYTGRSLTEYIEAEGKSVLGTACSRFSRFPVLIKLIDAKQDLSLQVHPDDEFALRVEGEYGKTEMWYVVDHEPGAQLIYGFKRDITPAEFKKSIEDNTILDLVNKVNVKKGDIFFVEAGTLHGIGAGILVAEIQQNSNTTYRIYDYGRVGADGRPRELHTEKAAQVTNLNAISCDTSPRGELEKEEGYERIKLISCPLFCVYRYHVDGSAPLFVDGTSFQSFTVLDGEGTLRSADVSLKLRKGDTVFIPAETGSCFFEGSGEFILTKLEEE